MITVQGRILPSPSPLYRAQITCSPNNGVWNLDPKKLGPRPFHVTKRLGSWRILVINSGSRDTISGGMNGLRHALEPFRKALVQYGLEPGQLEKPCVVNLNPKLLLNKETQEIREQIKSGLIKAFEKPLLFLFVLLPNKSAVLYNTIKLLLDCSISVPNVCCISSKFARLDIYYFANVVMKFN